MKGIIIIESKSNSQNCLNMIFNFFIYIANNKCGKYLNSIQIRYKIDLINHV